MSNRPILMSAPMVRALLAGIKTQTRRRLKVQPEAVAKGGGDLWRFDWPSLGHEDCRCPYGAPGDLLRVRETWRVEASCDDIKPVDLEHDWPVQYEAGVYSPLTRTVIDDRSLERPGKTRVSIHMPGWASRLTLEIIDVRVERLREISAADAVAEGIERPGIGAPFWKSYRPDPVMPTLDPVRSYAGLWEAINGPGSWAADPWVWAVSFKVFHANVDQMLAQIGDNPNG